MIAPRRERFERFEFDQRYGFAVVGCKVLVQNKVRYRRREFGHARAENFEFGQFGVGSETGAEDDGNHAGSFSKRIRLFVMASPRGAASLMLAAAHALLVSHAYRLDGARQI